MKTVRYRWFSIACMTCVIILCTLFMMVFKDYIEDEVRQHNILKPAAFYNKNNDTLFDLENFKFIMNNVSICTNSAALKQSSIAIVVHTSRSHFSERYAIRNTWGSIKIYKGWHLHLAFLLGSDTASDSELEARLWEENQQHGDLIMGNFVDSYRNLTYKHLMGYKWVSSFCPTAKFILKTDDDAYVDVFQLVEVLLVELINSRKTYACSNMKYTKPLRDARSKWYVNEDQYAGEYYPEYCTGLGYLMKSDGAAKIYSMCNEKEYLFIDDAFVTGILREDYNSQINNTNNETIDILTSNHRYDLKFTDETRNWCNLGMDTYQLKSTFILLRRYEIVHDMFCIWNKVRLMKFAMNNAVVTDS